MSGSGNYLMADTVDGVVYGAIIPEGVEAAHVVFGGNISQAISGFVIGNTYTLTFAAINYDSDDYTETGVVEMWNPAGAVDDLYEPFIAGWNDGTGANPFLYLSYNFVASDTDLVLYIITDSTSVLNIDDVSIVQQCTTVGTADPVDPCGLVVYEKAAQGPTTGEFTVVLDSSPGATDTITVDIDPNSNGNGDDLSVLPTQLTFTSADWDTPQTVTVTAIDDTWADGQTEVDQVGFTLTSAESDPCYADACISSVSVTIMDDDSDVILVSKTSASIAEGGGGDSYTIELATDPTDPVTILVAADYTETSETDPNMIVVPFDCQLTVNGGGSDMLVFTQGGVPQTVTIAVVDDSMVETDPHTVIISNIVLTDDAIYSGLSADNVSVDIGDDDARGWSFGDDAALTVANYSFETPALGDGGVQDFNEVNTIDGHEYWAAGELKIVNPTSGEWTAMYKTATEAPDGTQILYLDLSDDFPAYSGTSPRYAPCVYLTEDGPVSYTFEVWVGVPEPNDAGAHITLYIDAFETDDAGSFIQRINVPATDTFTLAAGDLVAGEWVELKGCGVIPDDGSLTGKALAVEVTGKYVHVDNFRLTVGNHPCDGCYAANNPTEAEGDLDDDCDVDLADFALLAGNFLECAIYEDGCLSGW